MIAALLTVLAIAVSASRLGSRVTRMRQFRSTASPPPPTSVTEYGDQIRQPARQSTWTRTILRRAELRHIGAEVAAGLILSEPKTTPPTRGNVCLVWLLI